MENLVDLAAPPRCWLRKLANIWLDALQKNNKRTSPELGLVRQPSRLSLTVDKKQGLRFHGYNKGISGFKRFYFERLTPDPAPEG